MSAPTEFLPGPVVGSGPGGRAGPGGAGPGGAGPRRDAALKAGRALLYPGLALTSVLVLRAPGEFPIGDVLIAFAGLFAVVSLRREPRGMPAVLWLAAVLLAIGGLLSCTVSTDPHTSLGITARLFYMMIIAPWIMSALLVEQRQVVRAALWWMAGGAICAFGALVQYGFGDVIPGGLITADNRFTGFTTHPSDLAGITTAAVGGALGAMFSGISRRARWCAGVILALCVIGLLLSGSVSGMLGLLAAGVFLVCRGAIRLRRAIVVAVGGIAIVAFATAQMQAVGARNPLDRFLLTTGQAGGSSESNTAEVRLELAHRALNGIFDSPLFGHGMVTADNVLMAKFTVHNNLLAAWHAGGVFVFVSVLIATVVGLRLRRRGRTPDPLREVVATAAVAAVAFAQTAPGLYNRYYWLPIAFAVVVALRSGAPGDPAEGATRDGGPVGRPTPRPTGPPALGT